MVYILLSFFITYIIFYLINKSLSENFMNNNKLKNTNILLLTMCVDTFNKNSKDDKDYRLKIYKKSIDNYLKFTNLDIYIIESSNNKDIKNLYNYNPRVHYHSFDLNNSRYIKNYSQSSTFYEIFSIKEAFDYFNLKKYNNIIKVTGRYYIPNIENIMNNLDNDNNLHIQYRMTKIKNKKTIYNHTEILGFKANYFNKLFDEIIRSNKNFEAVITDLNKKEKCSKLPKIILKDYVKRGGDKLIMKYL